MSYIENNFLKCANAKGEQGVPGYVNKEEYSELSKMNCTIKNFNFRDEYFDFNVYVTTEINNNITNITNISFNISKIGGDM